MRERLVSEISALIDRLADGGRDDAARDALLLELASYQRDYVEPYRRLWAARGTFAALPTDVFRYTRVAVHPPAEDRRVFLTSGTTSGARGAHAFRDLSLYDRSAEAAARFALFFDVDRIDLVMLAPHPDEAPESSLSYMLGLFETSFGARTDWLWRDGRLDVSALAARAREAERQGAPIALLGTSFAFVHAEDALFSERFSLPSRSRIMQTGGTKGRSREVDNDALRAALAERYGLPETHIVAEYGMTELSSQMYESTLRNEGPRRLWVPGWVRASVVDPMTLAPVVPGRAGLLRIDDLANIDSVCAIQTSDLAIDHEDGIELLGRAPGATPRGCSLAVEEALA